GITLLDGRDGSSVGSIPLTTYNYMALADVDSDGAAEIITDDEGVLVLLEADGTEVWRDTVRSGPSIAIADLDGDGDAEIFCGGRALNSSDGSLIFALTESYLSRDPAIGDLDLDGTQEIIYGSAVWDSAGAKLYDLPITLGEGGYWPAIVQADSDPEPEIILLRPGNIAIIEHDGVVVSENTLAGSSGTLSGAPTVADLDGDGELEIAFYEPRSSTFPRIVAFELDGTPMWSTVGAGLDGSSDPSGVSSFDFDKDGAYEVVSSTPIGLRILDGATGTAQYSIGGNWSGIFDQQPIIADVDGDGSAEVATLARTSASTGVIVVEQVSSTWPETDRQWTQFGWAAGNIGPDATIPSAPTYWQDYNVWRGQSPVNRSGVDLRVEITDVCVSSCDSAVGVAAVAVSVSNYGTQSATQPVVVSLYRSDAGTLTWLDSQTLAGVNRAEQTASLIFDLPITDLGSAGLVARVDASQTSPDGTVSECDEANNEDAWAYSVCP
ncbi:MAG: FG-GAP repeat domain-containing protein, partial [Myxococcota bacterium]